MSSFLLVLTLLSPSPGDSVYGVVHDAVTGAPLAGVRVETGPGGPAALSTLSGAYSLATLPSGVRSLQFGRAGYDSLQLRIVVSGSSLHLDVELQPIPQSLPPIEVAGTGWSSSEAGQFTSLGGDSSEIGLRHFRRNALWSDPLATSDDPLLMAATSGDAGALAGLPGAMHVHGGSGDQNLLLLDGLPVYGGMHPGGGAGLLNPDAVAEVDLHSAVPPASLGGRLSSAVDVHLLPPSDRPLRVTGAWDPTALRQLVEGSFAHGAGSILISGRQSYRGVFAQDGDGWLSNGFHDLLARGSFTSRGDDIRLYLLRSGDRLNFPAIAGALQGNNTGAPTGLRNRFSSSTSTAGVVWTRSHSRGPMLTTRLWSASSRAAIDWSPAPALVQVGSELDEIGLSSELFISGSSSSQRIGVSFQRTEAAYEVSSNVAQARFSSAPSTLSAFVEDRRTLGRWSTSTGLRATSVAATGPAIEPRLSVQYHLVPAVTLSLGAARLHQYVQSMRNEESLLDHAFAAELPVSLGAIALSPARSDQLTAELETHIGANLTLTFDGYARRFNGLLVPAAITAAPFAPSLPPLASGSAKGVELQARYSGKTLEARAGLGLAFTERDLGTSEFTPTALRSRWATGGIARKFGERSSIRLAAMVSDGGPTSVLRGGVEWQSPGGIGSSGEIAGSPQEIVGPLNSVRLPLFFRTDLGLTRRWRIGMAGKDGQLTTTFTVTNLFDRHNVLGYAQNGSERRALLFPSRSLIAQIGWDF